jgi:hypothetical protein
MTMQSIYIITYTRGGTEYVASRSFRHYRDAVQWVAHNLGAATPHHIIQTYLWEEPV